MFYKLTHTQHTRTSLRIVAQPDVSARCDDDVIVKPRDRRRRSTGSCAAHAQSPPQSDAQLRHFRSDRDPRPACYETQTTDSSQNELPLQTAVPEIEIDVKTTSGRNIGQSVSCFVLR